MAIYSWIAGSGNLDISSNWSQPDPKNPRVPGAGGAADTAIIAGAGITLTGSMYASILSLSGDLTLSGGNISSDTIFPFNGTLHLVAGASLGGHFVTGFLQDEGKIFVSGPDSLLYTNTEVGYSGVGEITVEKGGAVNADFFDVGKLAGSSGTATVTGLGSSINTVDGGQFQNIQVGQDGKGTLIIADQAVVTTVDMEAAVNFHDGVTDDLEVHNAKLTVYHTLIVGMGGSATATFDTGADVKAQSLIIGRDSDSVGTVKVDGSTTKVLVGPASGTVIGNEGTGTLQVTNGASVNGGAYINLGVLAGAYGELDVLGGAAVTTAQLNIGFSDLGGTAKIVIDAGSTIAATQGAVLSNGTIDLTGGGSIGVGSTATTIQGAVNVGAGAFFLQQSGSGTINGKLVDDGTVSVNGTLNVTGGTVIDSGANEDVYSGGSVSNTTINSGGIMTVHEGGMLSGNIVDNGTLGFNISGSNNFRGTLTGVGTLSISGGGNLTLRSADAFNGLAIIGPSSTLEVEGTASGGKISFGGPNAVLKLDQPGSFNDFVSGLQIGDTLDLAVPIKTEAIDGNLLTLYDVAGNVLTYQIDGQNAVKGFLITADGSGGSNLICKASPALEDQSYELAGRVIDAYHAGQDGFLKGAAFALETGEAAKLLEASESFSKACTALGVGIDFTVAGATLTNGLQQATSADERYQAVKAFDVSIMDAIVKNGLVYLSGASSTSLLVGFLEGLLGTTVAVGSAPFIAAALVGVGIGYSVSAAYSGSEFQKYIKESEGQHFDSTWRTKILQDGPVAWATVFADANNNRILDRDEVSTSTDQNGNFILAGGASHLVAFGGIDTFTNLSFKATLSAPRATTLSRPSRPLSTTCRYLVLALPTKKFLQRSGFRQT